MMRFRRQRKGRPVEQLRDDWDEEFRAIAGPEPGSIRVAVNDDATGSWAEIEIGTGQTPDLIRLLESAHAEAQRALDRTIDAKG
jgi:hypothetical protein